MFDVVQETLSIYENGELQTLYLGRSWRASPRVQDSWVGVGVLSVDKKHAVVKNVNKDKDKNVPKDKDSENLTDKDKNKDIIDKHRKNCECCPVSQLIVR